MEEYKVLLTTSGIGSRLGTLTNYTNKSLVRINNKPTISHIVEKYPKDVEFVVTLGYFGNHVKEFLQLAYPQRKFTFVNVEKYKGEGSSLGYSMLKAQNHLQCPFIFHACDTIIDKNQSLNNNFILNRKNFVLGNTKTSFDQYRTIQSNLVDNTLSRFREKGEEDGDEALVYIGVCGIYDYSNFWEELRSLYFENSKNNDLSDCHVINQMVKNNIQFHVEKINKWYDIGNNTSLHETRKSLSTGFEILDKVDESIFMFHNSIIKFFSDVETTRDRVDRASTIPGTPKILDYGDNFFKYEKAQGNLFSRSVTDQKFSRFLDWMENNVWLSLDVDNFEKDCYEFYFTKTQNRIDKYTSQNFNSPTSKHINGRECLPISEILEKVDKDWLINGIPCTFHGDCILDNIIESQDRFTLIDWRQNFNGKMYGDVYYDLAKLNHNLTFNHDIVNLGHYKCSVEDDSWEVDILTSNKLQDCKEILYKFIIHNNYDLNKVKFLTALIWINMSPLHPGKLGDFLMNFGQLNLDKIYKEINNE